MTTKHVKGKPNICPPFVRWIATFRYARFFVRSLRIADLRCAEPHQLDARGFYTFVICDKGKGETHTHTYNSLHSWIPNDYVYAPYIQPCVSIYHPYLFLYQFRHIQFCWLNFWHCIRSIYSLIRVAWFQTLPTVYILSSSSSMPGL